MEKLYKCNTRIGKPRSFFRVDSIGSAVTAVLGAIVGTVCMYGLALMSCVVLRWVL